MDGKLRPQIESTALPLLLFRWPGMADLFYTCSFVHCFLLRPGSSLPLKEGC